MRQAAPSPSPPSGAAQTAEVVKAARNEHPQGLALITADGCAPNGANKTERINRIYRRNVALSIFRNTRTGAVLHYESRKERNTLLPGLSKRNTEWLKALSNYQVAGESTYPHSEERMYGYVNVELRVLSYDIIEEKTGIDVLDLIQK